MHQAPVAAANRVKVAAARRSRRVGPHQGGSERRVRQRRGAHHEEFGPGVVRGQSAFKQKEVKLAVERQHIGESHVPKTLVVVQRPDKSHSATNREKDKESDNMQKKKRQQCALETDV